MESDPSYDHEEETHTTLPQRYKHPGDLIEVENTFKKNLPLLLNYKPALSPSLVSNTSPAMNFVRWLLESSYMMVKPL